MSNNHVRSSAPFGLVASGIELRMMAVATRRRWLTLTRLCSKHVRILRAPNRPCATSQRRSIIASKMKSLAGGPKRRQHLSRQDTISHLASIRLDDHVLNNIVPELVEKEWRRESSQVLRDQSHLFGALNAFYDLLCGPSAIFVDTDHGQMRSDALEHGESWSGRAFLKQFLYNLNISV